MRTRDRRSIAALAILFLGGCGVQQAFDEPSVTDDGTHVQLLPTGTFTVKPPPPKPTAPRPTAPTPTPTVPPPAPPITPPTDPAFYVRALGRMCMDFGTGAIGNEATLQLCNQSLSQQIGVREVQYGGVYVFHDVTFHVNGYCVGSRGGPAPTALLELEACSGMANQEFALDGDSIMAGAFPQPENAPAPPPSMITGVNGTLDPPIARQFVVAPAGSLTSAGTPFALETRQLTESEYLQVVATDQSSRAPHTGYVPVANGPDLVAKLQTAGWGTVLELVNDGDSTYDITAALVALGDSGVGTNLLHIPSGVTVRGDRHWVNNGPQIVYDNNDVGSVITIDAGDVRVTGLRFQGPSSGTDAAVTLEGITIQDGTNVLIDHVEVSQFSQAAIEVDGTPDLVSNDCPLPDSGILPPYPRTPSVTVARNFVHDNVAAGEGYGLNSSHGAFPLFDGNVGYMNRHTVAGDDNGLTGYIAEDNFVLSQTPAYDAIGYDHEQDFDQHAALSLYTDDLGATHQDHTGGYAGDYDVIDFNTFLGTDHHSFYLRGQPCRQGEMDQNIFVEGAWSTENAALDVLDYNGDSTENPIDFFITPANLFSVTDPTGNLGVGDFDGDGTDDVFVGTGAGWYYSSGAQAEWRFLQRMPEHASQLRFGDIDGDGRTDILAVHNLGTLDVSWGGVSAWVPLLMAPAAVSIGNFATGNFDNDPLHRDDIFMTDWIDNDPVEPSWYLAFNGQAFTRIGASSNAPTDLRFGDFDDDGMTDVFSIDGGSWAFSSAAQKGWQPLSGPSTPTMEGVWIGDYDGDGTADVGLQTFDPVNLAFLFGISSHGTSAFQEVQATTTPPVTLTGRFGPTIPAGAVEKPDLLLTWGYDALHFVAAQGAQPLAVWSRQEMR